MNTSEGPVDCLPYIFTSFWRSLSTVLRERRDTGSFFPAEGLLFLNLVWSPGASYLGSPLFCFPGGCGGTLTLTRAHTHTSTHAHTSSWAHAYTHSHTHAPHTQHVADLVKVEEWLARGEWVGGKLFQ